MFNKRHLLFVLLLVVGAALAACAETEVPVTQIVRETVVEKETVIQKETVVETVIEEKSVVVTATPAPPVSEPVVLRVGSTKPFKSANKFGDYWYGVLSNLTSHDTLIKLGADMQPQPWLATDWEISQDSQTFTFTLAEGARWHDGTPLTAEDAKFSLEYYRDQVPSAGWMQGVIDTIEVDGNRLIVNLQRPYGNLLTEFMTYGLIPKHVWETVDDPETYQGADVALGSGPFKLESWDETAGKYTFVANTDYFRGAPTVDRLEVEVFSNMDALVIALAQGKVDVWWDYSGEFPYTHVPALLRAEDVEFASATFLGVPAALGFNLTRYPVSELAFRQALAQAINYEQIAGLVFHGYGTAPTAGFVPPTHPNFNAALPTLTFDPEQAAAQLDALGLVDSDGDGLRETPEGEDLVLNLLARSDQASIVRSAELLVSNLSALGIGTELTAVDSSTWVAIKDEMDYDIVFFRATPWGTLMHASHGSGYFDARRTGAGVLHNLDAPEYLQMCDARLATALPEAQRELDLQLQALHQEYLPGIPLVWIDSVYPYRTGWENWVIDHIYGGVVNSFSWFQVQKKTE